MNENKTKQVGLVIFDDGWSFGIEEAYFDVKKAEETVKDYNGYDSEGKIAEEPYYFQIIDVYA